MNYGYYTYIRYQKGKNSNTSLLSHNLLKVVSHCVEFIELTHRFYSSGDVELNDVQKGITVSFFVKRFQSYFLLVIKCSPRYLRLLYNTFHIQGTYNRMLKYYDQNTFIKFAGKRPFHFFFIFLK